MLTRVLLWAEFYQLKKPLRVWTTDCSTGEEVVFGTGAENAELYYAVLASMAIKGIFPSVSLNHGIFSDGGTNSNLPLPDDFVTYDEVWFLIATPPTEFPDRDGIICNLLLNVTWAMEAGIRKTLKFARLLNLTDDGKERAKIFIVRPTCGRESSMLRFDHSLIETAEMEATSQISMQIDNPTQSQLFMNGSY